MNRDLNRGESVSTLDNKKAPNTLDENLEGIGVALKVHYLDASVLVKLVAEDSFEEPGRCAIRKYFNKHASFMTTSYCLSETFSIFKVKYLYRKQITQEDYIRNIDNFIKNIVGGKLEIDEIPILSPILLIEAEKLIKKYDKKTDFIDAMQIVAVLRGTYFRLCGRSKSILITADKNLAKVARSEGAKAWYFVSEPPP